jgi:hypothetical protein
MGAPGGGANGNGVAPAADRATKSLRVLRGGMVGLAIQATGTAGPVGKIAQGLLLMGGGSTLVLGVAAGIGVMAIAVRAMTRDLRDNVQAQEEMIAALNKLGTHGQITAIRTQIDALIQERDHPTLLQRFKRAPTFSGPRIGGGWRPEELEQINREIAKLQGLLGQLTREFESPWNKALAESTQGLREAQIAFENVGETTAVVNSLIEASRLKFEQYPKDVRQAIVANHELAASQRAIAEASRNVNTTFTDAQIQFNMLGQSAGAVQEALDRFHLSPQGIPEDEAIRLASLQRQAREMLQAVADFEQIRDWGIRAGQQFVRSFAEGMFKMEDFLKMLFVELLDIITGTLFGKLFGKFGGGLTGGAQGKGVADIGKVSGQVVPANLGLSMNMGGLQPLTVFAISRDPGFQQVIRESILVAASQGFKG